MHDSIHPHPPAGCGCCTAQDFEGENSAYDVLGLEAGASQSEIKKAYRKLSMEHHPDKNPQDPEGAAERMANINNAYEKLNEISKRRDEKAAGTGAGSKRSRDEKAKRYRGEK
jgi:curved DNA-binding protein CbpA